MKHFCSSLAYLVIATLLISSCMSEKKTVYLQDPVKTSKAYPLQKKEENVIKPNDELFIKVSSLDDVSYNYFMSESEGSQVATNSELSLSLISYTVNETGNIYFPVIGQIYVKDLTLEELRVKLEKLLEDYFNQPTVIVKFAYKKIAILGEVNRPGNYAFAKEQLSIFDALSMAGDITPVGNIKEVVLLRPEGDSIKKSKIDLRDDNLVFNDYYYLKADDVLYVQPLRARSWRIVSTPISLALYAITTTLLVYSAVK